jgi:hypothetical protein
VDAKIAVDARRHEMTGKGALQYLKDLCDRIDLRNNATIRKAVAVAALPAVLGFTTACYAASFTDDYYGYDQEVCYNSIDDDYDGYTDCADTECATREVCLGCDDGQDNDGDGLADCDDASCQAYGPCADEICGDGVDNDANGAVDCDDPECEQREGCLRVYDEEGFLVAACGDGVDNDEDGLADCVDRSCAGGEFCQGVDACSDYTDNDGDGLIDCYDPDCNVPVCN